MEKIQGTYRHYKGGLYEVIALARHSETLEDMVVYRSLTDPQKVWVRPAAMWGETVCVQGKCMARFEPIQAPGCQIIRSDRRTLALRILPDGTVQVRAPRKIARARIDAFVDEHRAWIEENQRRVLRRQNRLASADVQELIRRAEQTIPPKVAAFALQMGVRPKSVRITQAKTRFGSCGVQNTLNFSCYLMLQEPAQIDYVVVHELAHILHKNHGPAFYACIERVLPDYRSREAALRQ